jgi:hypothetical protein
VQRYTKRDAEAAFTRLREAAGKRYAYDFPIHDRQREGAWALDYNSAYGGYEIVEIVADSPPRDGDDRPQAYTAHSVVSGRRRTAREFVEWCNAAIIGMSLKP